MTKRGLRVLSLLADWSVYVLVISAVVGFVLQQRSLRTGVLAPAMASSNLVTLFSSVILGIAVCGEKVAASGGPYCVRLPARGRGGWHRVLARAE